MNFKPQLRFKIFITKLLTIIITILTINFLFIIEVPPLFSQTAQAQQEQQKEQERQARQVAQTLLDEHQRQQENALPQSYLVGPKDLLAITVLEAPEMNITARVSEAGNITVPLLGIIRVDGLTRSEIERKITSLLQKSFIKNPQVTVFIKEYKSRLVSIVGAVSKPGNYELIGKQNLLQIMGSAGWLTDSATGEILIIRKGSDGKTEPITADLHHLTKSGSDEHNIQIQSGDIIIAKAYKTGDIYVFGQVNQPGLVTMKLGENMTLLRLIVKAGGFTDRARKGSVTVKRKINGKEIKMKVNVKKILKAKKPDFLLQPDDIVYVPESLF
jgi:polysaccharide biosynthesis/export protein